MLAETSKHSVAPWRGSVGSVSYSGTASYPKASADDESSGTASTDSAGPYHGRWGDQGDGTYINPILPADYSDLDAIRVDQDYYAISSTFQFSPGVVVLHSRDLVNRTLLGHVVSDLTQIGPALNWDAMDCYGRGIWAPAIRYHAARYWVYFCTPDEGLFMSTASSASGPWTPLVGDLTRASYFGHAAQWTFGGGTGSSDPV